MTSDNIENQIKCYFSYTIFGNSIWHDLVNNIDAIKTLSKDKILLADLNKPNKHGVNPLNYCSDYECFMFLISIGAKLIYKYKDGSTNYSSLLMKCDKILRYCLDNFYEDCENDDGTILHEIITYEHIENLDMIIQFLVDRIKTRDDLINSVFFKLDKKGDTFFDYCETDTQFVKFFNLLKDLCVKFNYTEGLYKIINNRNNENKSILSNNRIDRKSFDLIMPYIFDIKSHVDVSDNLREYLNSK